MPFRLNSATIELIRSTPQLYADVSTAMKVQPSSLEPLLRKNGKRLTEYDVLRAISSFCGKPHDELVEECAEEDEFSEKNELAEQTTH